MRIGVLTSGGDAPGMNACLRSIVKAGIGRGHTIVGVERGYSGLLEGAARELSLVDVDGASRRGGTLLGSARCKEMMTEAGQARANEQLGALKLEGLIVVGGNGSLTGARVLVQRGSPAKIVGVPASIDNDLGGTSLAIGVDTALNTIVEACDRISDTASAHRRVFIVEVMGRQCGYLAMRSGIAAEADAILYAEKQITEDALVEKLRSLIQKSFSSSREKKRVLIIKAEGVAVKTSVLVERLSSYLEVDAPGVDIRETVLGHVVRGGAPSVTDRVIAQRLGFGALQALEDGVTDVMCGWEPPGGIGEKTADPSIRRVTLEVVLDETRKLLDGTSPVTRARIALLSQVEGLLAL
ncbi:MAG: 6-phosphofructokinase [Deltaproteobacteria bacterium]|nr:6-phosphofructokinase [Deltaproteobacteria bacterium]